MGFYVNHEYNAKYPAGSRRTTNNNDPVSRYLEPTVSIFGTLVNKLGDGKGGSDEEQLSAESKKQIEDLENKIDAKLKEADASSIADLSSKITASQEAQKTISSNISNIESQLLSHNSTLSDFNTKISNLDHDLEQNPSKSAEIQAQIKSLNTQKLETQKQIDDLKQQKGDLEKELKIKQLKQAELEAKYAEIENYQHRIDKIKTELPKEVTYDVTKETDDLSNFSAAMKKFRENPSMENAATLYNVYNDGDNGVQNQTAKKAYEFIERQYPEYFDKIKAVKG